MWNIVMVHFIKCGEFYQHMSCWLLKKHVAPCHLTLVGVKIYVYSILCYQSIRKTFS